MLTLCSFLQSALLFVKSLAVKVAKSDYRRKAVLMSAGLVFTVVAFTSSGFGGGGKSALTVFAKLGSADADDEGGDEEEEIETITEADIRIELTDRIEEGQQVVGYLLVQEIREGEQKRIMARRHVADIRDEIRQEELEEIRLARQEELNRAEEARRLAEEKRRQEEEEKRRLEEERKRQEEAERKKKEEARLAASAVSLSADDYQVLLRIVQAEAGICDAKGRILVANVILNRVRSKEFPDTVRGVVYQRSQFSPVSNGTIDTCKVTSQTIDCVDRALRGEDYSQGALYFMNRGKASSGNASWFDSHLTYLFSHDKHEFFK